MRRRVVGIETEYGLTAASTDGADPRVDADLAARYLFDPLLARGRSSNLFLRNGGRMYLDVGSHPEYATAECDDLWDLLAQDRAGSVMFADLARQADTTLESEEIPARLHLFRNNVDAHGNSYGCHENYLLHRRRDFREVADALVAYFVTRQVLVGAGYVRTQGETTDYAFSQRSEQMWDAVSAATTRSRPIINTRDEPLADSGSYRRMHVIVGDTNVAEPTTALKIGATELLLSAIEDGLRIADLALADPMRAIREINVDLDARHRVELADGRWMSAVEIQREIRERTLARTDRAALDDLHRYVLDLWGRGIEALASGNWDSVNTELDVAIKRRLLESYTSRQGVSLGDARVARLDLSYHDITSQGIQERMEAGALMVRLTSPEQVHHAVETPPQTTRAALRGRVIGAAEDARRDLTVDWVHVRLDDQSSPPLALQDPLSSEDPRIDALIDRIHDETPTLPA